MHLVYEKDYRPIPRSQLPTFYARKTRCNISYKQDVKPKRQGTCSHYMKQTACMWSQTVTTVDISVLHFQTHTICTLASTCIGVVSPRGKTTPMHARSAQGMIWIRISGMGVSWRWVVTILLVSELLWEVEYDGPSLNPFCFSGKNLLSSLLAFLNGWNT